MGDERKRKEGSERIAQSTLRIPLSGLASLVKPGVVASNTLTACAGLVLASAGRGIDPGRFLISALGLASGTALLVAGSCVLNNWLDRDIDTLMERTRGRPTASGMISPFQAIVAGLGFVVAGLCLLLLQNAVCALVGLAGAFVYVVVYSILTKRRTSLSSFIGGISGSIPPLIGWAAVDPSLGGSAWWLFILLIVWQQAHVRALAQVRKSEYREAGLPMAGLGGEEPGSKAAILVWTAALLPLVLLLPGLAFMARAAISSATTLWLLAGIFGLGRPTPAWASRMFAASLAWLVISFCALILSTL